MPAPAKGAFYENRKATQAHRSHRRGDFGRADDPLGTFRRTIQLNKFNREYIQPLKNQSS